MFVRVRFFHHPRSRFSANQSQAAVGEFAASRLLYWFKRASGANPFNCRGGPLQGSCLLVFRDRSVLPALPIRPKAAPQPCNREASPSFHPLCFIHCPLVPPSFTPYVPLPPRPPFVPPLVFHPFPPRAPFIHPICSIAPWCPLHSTPCVSSIAPSRPLHSPLMFHPLPPRALFIHPLCSIAPSCPLRSTPCV